jgi:competence protein ComEA
MYGPLRRFLATAALASAIVMTGPHIPSLAAETPPTTAVSESNPVDLNTADAERLGLLPGIGPSMAGRIIEFRDEHGPFRRVEDLLKIKGIGEKSFQKLRPLVTVSKPS